MSKNKTTPHIISVLKEVFRTPRYLYLFLPLAILTIGVYTILLPYEFTQRVSFVNWNFLTPQMMLFSVLLGTSMAMIITLQLFSIHKVALSKTSSAPGFGFILSLLPTMTCCSPLVPTLLATLGMSGIGVASTSGTIQSFFALHQSAILSFSLIWLLITIAWSAHKIAISNCFSPLGCEINTEMESFSAVQDNQK